MGLQQPYMFCCMDVFWELVGLFLVYCTQKLTDTAWRLALVLGLVTAPFMAALFFGIFPVVEIESDWIAVVVAGLHVGFGAQYGSGCTSGHGICGLSRLSPRSLVATLSFMGAGFLTVFVLRHLIGL